MRRELRSVATEAVVGVVVLDDAGARFEGHAVGMLRKLRAQLGDAEVARRVLAEGWSNGYIYFADPTP